MNNVEKINEGNKYWLLNTKNNYFNQNNSNFKIIRQKTNLKIPCSIKPASCIIPRDINLKQLFIQLFNSSCSLNKDNKIYTKLSPDEISTRKYIIESIKNFVINHRIKYKILYNIIYMLDILICYNNKNKVISNFEKLGLGSVILTLKFMNEEYLMIPLNKFKSFYENKSYTIYQLQEIEINSLKLLDYYLNFPTPYSFMELLFLNGIVFSTDNIKTETSHKIYNLALNSLEKIMIKSNEYIKYNPLNLCCGIVAYSRDFHGIEKWPKILSKVFDVIEKNFDDIYKEFFSQYNHQYIKSSNNIIDKLFIKKYYISNSKEKNNYYKNNQDKNNNDININNINKDITTYQENKENKINSNINIRVNYKTSQEIRNSALFRKMYIKYQNKSMTKRIINNSDNLTINTDINLKNDTVSTIINEETKNNQLNYDLNKFKSINSNKKPLTNIYKTPSKFGNEYISSCFYKPNKKSIEYNLHQKNISNVSISIKDNNMLQIAKNKNILNSRDNTSKKCDEFDINNKDININNNKENNESNNLIKKDINNFLKKINNKTIDEKNSKINFKDKEEIRVRVKDFYNNNREMKKQKISFINNFIQTESEYDNNINENDNNLKERKNNEDNKESINFNSTFEPYKNNLLLKNVKSSLRTNDKDDNNIINIPQKKEYSYFNEIKNISVNRKKVSLNRDSSYKPKYNNEKYRQNKDEEYSNETTSENSYNCSIRRNYFKLKRLKDRLSNINNDNTTIVNNNLTNDNKSISAIKSNVNNFDKINNGIKSTKFKDCLRIGYNSIDRRVHIKYNGKEKAIKKEKDSNKSINVKKCMEIRNFYKLKNIKNNNVDINEKSKENYIDISRNFLFQ